MTSALVDLDDTRRAHAQRDSYRPDFESGDRCVAVDFAFPAAVTSR